MSTTATPMTTPPPASPAGDNNVSPELVKQLRDKTSAGMMDCKKALVEARGDLAQAETILRKKGAASASKKAGREAKEGVIGSYIHIGDKVGVLVEINCETDFVARNESFRAFVKDVTLQVAAATPLYVKRDEVPESLLAVERDVASASVKGKPAAVVDKIIAGKLDKYYSTVCLLEQTFVKDNAKTISDLLNAKIAELGENIVIRRFTRFQVGETLAGQVAAPETPAA
ncbi:MAG: translation elongation factor Ts [Methylacidiphilales bacterium]|nr:translation elongation factor Ts [Candidatus Methylacidiphilales bacterium]